MQEEVGALDADDSELAPQLLESRVSSIVAGGRVDRISSVGGYYDRATGGYRDFRLAALNADRLCPPSSLPELEAPRAIQDALRLSLEMPAVIGGRERCLANPFLQGCDLGYAQRPLNSLSRCTSPKPEDWGTPSLRVVLPCQSVHLMFRAQ